MGLYFFSRLGGAFRRRLRDVAQAPIDETDPIDHPAIAAMSMAELADLPLGPDWEALRANARADKSVKSRIVDPAKSEPRPTAVRIP